ncbi:MAG: triose-phosphate isomerase [Spirochaetales bacterium]|nr:triose-phosphate isomerase [Spirochaetales bacterium]
MRSYFIAGNWKMHKTVGETVSLINELKNSLKGVSHKVLVAPPFTALDAAVKAAEGSNILVGAQNMSNKESGAHTGEVSVVMLKDLGVGCVILGHSERRIIYKESDAFINEKVKLALVHGLEVILCVGETLEEREAGKAETVVNEQLEKGLSGISEDKLPRITIAYEPVWAIGTGKTATPEDADEIHASARKKIAALYSQAAADAMLIQYGGSVKPDNAKELMAMDNIDGALVGGAALDSASFTAIARFDS